jgi:hypothetical protein
MPVVTCALGTAPVVVGGVVVACATVGTALDAVVPGRGVDTDGDVGNVDALIVGRPADPVEAASSSHPPAAQASTMRASAAVRTRRVRIRDSCMTRAHPTALMYR